MASIGPADAQLGLARYDYRTVDQVPATPGLYAWYPLPAAGAADLNDAESLHRLLSEQSRRMGRPPLALTGSDSFDQVWTGQLAEEFEDTQLQWSASEDSHGRELLARVLTGFNLLHFFMGPLYVGRSDNLHTRVYDQHFVQLVRYSEQLREDETFRRTLGRKKQTFATRAALAGFRSQQLAVYCWDTSAAQGAETSLALASDIAREAEYYLNQWTRPILGRS